MSLTAHTKKRSAHSRTNPVPMRERLYTTRKEFSRHFGIGLRKVNQLIAEGRLKTSAVDSRNMIDVRSGLALFEANAGRKLTEPEWLARSKTTKETV